MVTTRSGYEYPNNPTTMETIVPSTSNMLAPLPRDLKRKRQTMELVSPAWDNAIVPPFENSKRPEEKCEIREGEKEAEQQRDRKRGLSEIGYGVVLARKRSRNKNYNGLKTNLLEVLPDDMASEILCHLSASAGSYADIVNLRLTCKRFNLLGKDSCVLAQASIRSLSVRAKVWSESAHQFLKACAQAGNLEACYILGMIYFYCLENRREGANYMVKAAMGSHPSALYSLAIIQFNGSGGTKADKNLRAGVTLCARAANLGHIDAMRELGHCLQDGYGIRRHVEDGRRLLSKASTLEIASIISHLRHVSCFNASPSTGSKLLELGCQYNIPDFDQHPANRFLVEWFASRVEKCKAREEIRACSHVFCGRVETRRHEFRRCSVCGKAKYCSRSCQAMDWKRAHRLNCVPPDAAAPLVGELAQLAGLVVGAGLIV